jgi:hypothetical protein
MLFIRHYDLFVLLDVFGLMFQFNKVSLDIIHLVSMIRCLELQVPSYEWTSFWLLMTYIEGNKTTLELSLANSNVISQIALNSYILFVVLKLPIFCNASGMPHESCDDSGKVHLLL